MTNKTVLITGASRGIGKSLALKFAKKKYNVIINASTSFKDLMDVNNEILDLGVDCLPVLADISNYNEVVAMFEEIFIKFPTIDIVINNAGISHIGLFTETTPDMWNKIISTNLNSLYNICHNIVPQMINRKKGVIINISSIWGNIGASCEVAYSASKGGVNAFTKALAKELGPSNIRVNAIACGAITTNMNSWMSEEDEKAFSEEISLCRFGSPDEVANLAYFLASDKASYLTGEVIKLDGGI